jgi:Tfp pilus assembly protein PilO
MGDFKKRLILTISISLSIILVLGGLFYYFHNDILKKVTKINSYRQELVSRVSILDRIYVLEQEHTKSLPYFTELKEALPTETEMVNLEEVLQDLAGQNDLNLSFRFGLLNEATEQEPKNYSFNLILTGEKGNILKWMDGLQKLNYTIRVDQIELTQTGSSGIESYYSAKILGRVYLR